MAVFVSAVIAWGSAALATVGAAVASIGTAVAGAVGITGLSTLAVTAIGSGVISGTITAIQGGSLSDVLKSAVIGGVTSYAGGYVSQAVSSSVTSGITGGVVGPPTAGAVAAGNVAGNVAAGVTRAAIMGQDLQRGALLGVAASTTSLLNVSPEFRNLPDSVKNVVSASASTLIRGGDVKEAAVMAAITSGNIVQRALAQSPELKAYMEDPKNKYSTEIALTTLNTALASSLVGGDVSKSTQDALVVSTIDQMGKVFNESYTNKVNTAQTKYAEASETQKNLDSNYAKQKEYATTYEKTYAELKDREQAQNDVLFEYNAKKASFEAFRDSGEIKNNQFYINGDNFTQAYNDYIAEYNTAAEKANKYITDNKNYFETGVAKLNTIDANIAELQKAALPLEQVYAAQVEDVTKYTNDVVEEGQKFVAATNKSIVSTIYPDFNADEYSKINALSDGVDPYTHYINFGKKEDASISYADAVSKDFADHGLTVPPSIAKDFTTKMGTSDKPVDALDQYFAERTFTPEEAIAQAEKVGIKLSQEEAVSLSGFGDRLKLSNNLGTYLTTRTESDKKLADTKTDIRDAITSKLQSEGYNVAANDPILNQFESKYEQDVRANISNMEDQAKSIADSKGKDSAEYKAIAKQVLDAKADFGGYGVIKTDSGYKVAGAGDIDGNTMVLASKTGGGYFDPVTNSWTIFVSGTSDTPENFVQKRLDETGYVSGSSMKYASAFSIGESATPPEGAGSYFGQGSGSTAGGGDTGSELLNKLGSFSPIAVDDASGKSYAETKNGFALITLADGRTVAVNQNDPEDVVWLTPEQLKQYQDKVTSTTPSTTTSVPVKTIDEIKQSLFDQTKTGIGVNTGTNTGTQTGTQTGTGTATGGGENTGATTGSGTGTSGATGTTGGTGGVTTTTGTTGGTGGTGGTTTTTGGTTTTTPTTGGTTVTTPPKDTTTPPKTDTTTPPVDTTTPPPDTTTPPPDTTTPPTTDTTKPPTTGTTMPTGGVGNIVDPEQLQQRQQRTNQLMSLLGLGGSGGTGQQQVTVKAPELAKINYIYDISGPSIFAGPYNNSLGGTETGTVDDLQKIMKG